EGAVGRTEEPRPGSAEQFDPSDLFEQLFVLIVPGQARHHRVGLGVIAYNVPGAQLEERSAGEVSLLFADLEEGRADVEPVEGAHETFGVWTGSVIEGERHLVPLRAPFRDHRRVGEEPVYRSVLALVPERGSFGAAQRRGHGLARGRVRAGRRGPGPSFAVGGDREDQQRKNRHQARGGGAAAAAEGSERSVRGPGDSRGSDWGRLLLGASP